jgi:hypothetical protein
MTVSQRTTEPQQDGEIACSSCGHGIAAFPGLALNASYRPYDGVFCNKCNLPFCRLCLEFQFVNNSDGATHVSCGGKAKLIRTKGV